MPFMALLGSQAAFGKVSDFPEYFGSMQMVCTGRGADIYRPKALFATQAKLFPTLGERGIAFYIPPFAIPLLAPLGLLPASPAFLSYQLAQIGAIIAGIILLAKYFQLDCAGTVWLAAVTCATAPMFESLKISQLAPFLFLAFAVFLMLMRQKKDFAAGLSLSVLLLKPQELLPLAIFLLFSRRFKIVGSLAGAFLLLTALSFVFIGHTGYANYFELLKDSASHTQYMQPELSATLRGQLLRLPGVSNAAANIVSSALLALTLLSIAWSGFRVGKSLDQREEARRTEPIIDEKENLLKEARSEQIFLLLALPLGLVSALHCHDYDLMLLAPWALTCLLSAATDKVSRVAQILSVLLLFALMVPIYIPIHYQWLMDHHGIINPIFILFGAASVASALSAKRSLCTPRQNPTAVI
jgi:hypothetical protein